MLASVWLRMTDLLTLEEMKYGNAVSKCWTLVRHMVYSLGIMKICHLVSKRDSIIAWGFHQL